MRTRAPVLALAGTLAVAIAAEPGLHSPPIIGAATMLCALTFIRPSQRLRELLVATTVAIGCLSSFVWALLAVCAALSTLAFWTRTEHSPTAIRPARRFLTAIPLATITIGLLVAIGLGDRRLDPVDGESNSQTQSTLAGLPDITTSERSVSVAVDEPDNRGVPFQLSENITDLDSLRVSQGANDFRYLSPGERLPSIQLIDQGSNGPGDAMSDRLPWLLALVGLLVGGYSVLASRRFRATPIVVTSPVSPSDRTPLDWYDRIVEQAGHPRHHADPVLRHSRRVAGETGDERFRDLGRLVSDHLYSGRSLTDADIALISRLHDDG